MYQIIQGKNNNKTIILTIKINNLQFTKLCKKQAKQQNKIRKIKTVLCSILQICFAVYRTAFVLLSICINVSPAK